MLVVLVVLLAVLALVLLMLLLQTRAELGSNRDTLTTTQRDLASKSAKVDQLDAETVRLDTELTGAHAAVRELETARDNALDEAISAGSRIAELEAEIEARSASEASLEASLAEVNAELETSRATADEHAAAAEAAAAEVLDLTHQNEELQVELVEAADEAAKRRAPSVPDVFVTDDDAGIELSGFSPDMAWQLELVRSERTWRYSVAANPVEDPSPFESTDNPLKLAIEIEALALREDVGAFIGIDWQAGNAIHPGTDPARAHLTLRLAQELLASAAREMSPSTLVVRPDPERGGVSLEVVASDPDDVDFKIPPPPIASEWIGIDEHGGMVVTVKVDDT